MLSVADATGSECFALRARSNSELRNSPVGQSELKAGTPGSSLQIALV